MTLTEAAIRTRVIELLDGCDQARMDAWLILGVMAGKVDADDAGRILNEELPHRSHDVQRYWRDSCNCHGHLN